MRRHPEARRPGLLRPHIPHIVLRRAEHADHRHLAVLLPGRHHGFPEGPDRLQVLQDGIHQLRLARLDIRQHHRVRALRRPPALHVADALAGAAEALLARRDRLVRRGDAQRLGPGQDGPAAQGLDGRQQVLHKGLFRVGRGDVGIDFEEDDMPALGAGLDPERAGHSRAGGAFPEQERFRQGERAAPGERLGLQARDAPENIQPARQLFRRPDPGGRGRRTREEPGHLVARQPVNQPIGGRQGDRGQDQPVAAGIDPAALALLPPPHLKGALQLQLLARAARLAEPVEYGGRRQGIGFSAREQEQAQAGVRQVGESGEAEAGLTRRAGAQGAEQQQACGPGLHAVNPSPGRPRGRPTGAA